MVLENTENLQSRAGRDFWWLANYIFWHFNIFVYKCKFENKNKKTKQKKLTLICLYFGSVGKGQTITFFF